MDQTHIGYTFWNEPPANAMPAVTEIQVPSEAKMGISAEGAGAAPNPMLPAFDCFNRQSYAVDIFNRGMTPFQYTVTADKPWILVDNKSGTVNKEARLMVSVDWNLVPAGESVGSLAIAQIGGPTINVRVRALRPDSPSRDGLEGFVEANGYVSIEAEHFSRKTAVGDVHWDVIPDYGETLSCVTVFPVVAASLIPPQNAPSLEYKMYLFDQGQFDVEAILAPTLNFVPGPGLRFAISFDDQAPQVVDALERNRDEDWAKAVSDGVKKVRSQLSVPAPGYHTLKFWMVDPGVVVEKIVVSHGPVKASYLGPPESYK